MELIIQKLIKSFFNAKTEQSQSVINNEIDILKLTTIEDFELNCLTLSVEKKVLSEPNGEEVSYTDHGRKLWDEVTMVNIIIPLSDSSKIWQQIFPNSHRISGFLSNINILDRGLAIKTAILTPSQEENKSLYAALKSRDILIMSTPSVNNSEVFKEYLGKLQLIIKSINDNIFQYNESVKESFDKQSKIYERHKKNADIISKQI